MHDDQLIGYLLGALEPNEMLEVERQLRDNPALRARLEKLEAMLEPFEQDREDFEPSSDLRDKTLNAIDAAIASKDEASRTDVVSGSTNQNDSLNGTVELLGSNHAELHRKDHRWWDFAFSTAAFAAVLALLFPALYQTRESARLVACQDNLRELGHMLTRFALASEEQRIPALEKSGREAFAGVYAVRLKGSGLLDEDPLVWCPASLFDDTVPEVPGPEALANADTNRLALWQQLAGGGYAYNLGILDQDRYQAPRAMGRTHFAWMSDVPRDTSQSVHPGVFNVLYEDGHVSKKAWHLASHGRSSLFLNDAGRREAGLSSEDSVLAPSPVPPFVWVEQR